jgi:hypothetical protein
VLSNSGGKRGEVPIIARVASSTRIGKKAISASEEAPINVVPAALPMVERRTPHIETFPSTSTAPIAHKNPALTFGIPSGLDEIH